MLEQNHFSYFGRELPRQHSCEVWLKLVQECRRNNHLKQSVDAALRTTDDAKRKTDIDQLQ